MVAIWTFASHLGQCIPFCQTLRFARLQLGKRREDQSVRELPSSDPLGNRLAHHAVDAFVLNPACDSKKWWFILRAVFYWIGAS